MKFEYTRSLRSRSRDMGVVVIVEECVRDVGLRWGRIYMYERRAAVLKPEG